MTEAAFNNIIKRLELATNRLEELAKSSSYGGSSNDSSSNDVLSPAVKAYDDILENSIQTFLDLSNTIGGPVKEQSNYFMEALKAQRQLILVASKSKKPTEDVIKKLILPISNAMKSICDIREKNRISPLFNHLSAMSESILALGWIMVEPAPAPYIEESIAAAQYYIIRVIKEFKEKEKSYVDWTKAYVAILTEIKDYVKKYHTSGLSWNPRGGNVSEATKGNPSTSEVPPPPPVAKAAPSGPKPDVSKLFADLNRGEHVTAGLKKVDPSERKNRPVSSVVKGTTGSSVQTETVKKPQKQVLDGNKWSIENFVGNKNIIVSDTEIRHLVYIYNCIDSTIQIKGKVNAITLDNCKKTGVVIDSVVAAVDVVNSKSVQVQINKKAPTISIDKTDGAQLYLSPECSQSVEIFSSKSSEMNVLIQQDDGDWIEKPIPEQFRTKISGNDLITNSVEHAG